MIKAITLTFIILLNSLIGCSQPRIFNDLDFYTSLERSSLTEYAICINKLDSNNCNLIYPVLDSLNYEKYLTSRDGDSLKLTAINEKMASLGTPIIKDSFIAMILYLEDQNHISKKLLNELLIYSLEDDTTNRIINYELAKLHYNEGYVGLSHFLVNNLLKTEPNNIDIIRMNNELINEYGSDTYDKSLNFKEYFEFRLHYIED